MGLLPITTSHGGNYNLSLQNYLWNYIAENGNLSQFLPSISMIFDCGPQLLPFALDLLHQSFLLVQLIFE